MKIFVIGCGRWGSFIAWYLNSCGHDVTLYGRESSANYRRFAETRRNGYLTLPDGVELTSDLTRCRDRDIIVVSIDTQALSSLIEQLREADVRDKIFVFCMKGIESKTGRRITEIAKDGLHPSNKTAVWLGPGHVQEFVGGNPNCMVIDSEDEGVKQTLIEAFSGGQIRFYYGTDVIGNEIGAASKNVIGIAAGILDGLGMGTLKGALMARGAREIASLIEAMGGNPVSAYGLCHLGDYEATVFSPHSHNRKFGECVVTGEAYNMLSEGYYTAEAMMLLSEKYNVELPICRAVYRVTYEHSDPKTEFADLFTREIKREF